MKKFLMYLLCVALVKACDFTHLLPDKQEEALQAWFIAIIGYRCPFALWSYHVNQRYGFNVWEKPNQTLNSDSKSSDD